MGPSRKLQRGPASVLGAQPGERPPLPPALEQLVLLGDEVGVRCDGTEHLASRCAGELGTGDADSRTAGRVVRRVPSILPAMPSVQETRPRVSLDVRRGLPFALVPRARARLCGRRCTGPSAFAAAPLLLVALAAGILLRLDKLPAGRPRGPGLVPDARLRRSTSSPWSTALVAIVDAWRVAHFLNAHDAAAAARRAPAAIGASRISVAGLLAVFLVMSGAHVVVARYDMLASNLATASSTAGGDAQLRRGLPPRPGGSDRPPVSLDPAVSLDPQGSALPDTTVPPWNGTDRLNILLIGVDQRPSEGTFNTDTLIVVSIDPTTNQVAMFSLPRDTVDVPVPAGPGPRDSSGRSTAARSTASGRPSRTAPTSFPGNGRDTRLQRPEVDPRRALRPRRSSTTSRSTSTASRTIVDALGGVTINVQKPVVDDAYPDDNGAMRVYIPAGMQHMTGAEALIYARSRHGSNDFDRAQRQQRVLLSLREQVDIGSDPARTSTSWRGALDRRSERTSRATWSRRLLGPRQTRSTHANPVVRLRAAPLRDRGPGQPARLHHRAEGGRDPRGRATAFKATRRPRRRARASATRTPRLGRERLHAGRGQASDIADYLEYLGMAASAPNQRIPDHGHEDADRGLQRARRRACRTIVALRERIFGVTASCGDRPVGPGGHHHHDGIGDARPDPAAGALTARPAPGPRPCAGRSIAAASGLLRDPVLQVAAGHQARLGVERRQVAEEQADHRQQQPLEVRDHVAGQRPRPPAAAARSAPRRSTRTSRQQKAPVSSQAAYCGRFWPSVVSANAGFISSGTFEPKMITNGRDRPVDVIEPQVDEAPDPEPARDLRVGEGVADVERDVGDAPRPAADLECTAGPASAGRSAPGRRRRTSG